MVVCSEIAGVLSNGDASMQKGNLIPNGNFEEVGGYRMDYYNQVSTDINQEYMRLYNGYWLWQSPIVAHTPYIYWDEAKVTALKGVRKGRKMALTSPMPLPIWTRKRWFLLLITNTLGKGMMI